MNIVKLSSHIITVVALFSWSSLSTAAETLDRNISYNVWYHGLDNYIFDSVHLTHLLMDILKNM